VPENPISRSSIVDTMYFPDDAMFFDVREGTHEKFKRCEEPEYVPALWANVPLSSMK